MQPEKTNEILATREFFNYITTGALTNSARAKLTLHYFYPKENPADY